jgi:multisubunit Na+/H+ antiporter MnhB subunit
MSADFAFDAILVLLVLAVACWIETLRQSFAAVVGFVAYGMLLSLVWVRLQAVDVALTESAIGGAATGVLLLGAAVRLRSVERGEQAELPGATLRILAAIFSAFVAAALFTAILLLPDPPPSLAPIAVANMPAGIGNPVTAVLLAHRAFDTLLEKVVLVLALLGVWSVTPDAFWGGRPGVRYRADPDGVLSFLAQVLPPIGLVIVIHLLWVGATEPGGAFQSAATLAAMWILAMRSGLADAPPISGRGLRLVLVAGPALFLAIGFAGIPLAGWFLAYPADFAKPLIVAVEIVLTLSLAAIVGLLVAGPPERAPPS